MKLDKASSNGEENTQAPMDDASFVPEVNPETEPNMMGGDPNMMTPDPNMMGQQDPNMMGDPNAMNIGSDVSNGTVNNQPSDETMSIINQLSDKDKEAVKSYAESMLKKDTAQNQEQQPMMESVIFSKKQIEEIKKQKQ